MLGGFLEIHWIPSHSPAASHSTHGGGAREQVVRRRPRRSAARWRWRCASGSGGWRRVSRSGSCCPACRQAEKRLSHGTCRGASPSRDLVNLTGERPPQTTRRGHRVAEQLLGAHRRPCWAHSGGEVLGTFGGDPLQTGISARKPPPPRRPYATRSRSAARISGRYGCYASMRQASSSNITILRRSEAVAAG